VAGQKTSEGHHTTGAATPWGCRLQAWLAGETRYKLAGGIESWGSWFTVGDGNIDNDEWEAPEKSITCAKGRLEAKNLRCKLIIASLHMIGAHADVTARCNRLLPQAVTRTHTNQEEGGLYKPQQARQQHLPKLTS
jgi:hypothetical protein